MHKILVIETFLTRREQNFYYVLMPDVVERGYYRAASSYNAFFNSMRNPKSNATRVRRFSSDHEDGIKIRRSSALYENVDWDGLKTFESIWEFYKFIGYDYKARKYDSGEPMMSWDGTKYV